MSASADVIDVMNTTLPRTLCTPHLSFFQPAKYQLHNFLGCDCQVTSQDTNIPTSSDYDVICHWARLVTKGYSLLLDWLGDDEDVIKQEEMAIMRLHSL